MESIKKTKLKDFKFISGDSFKKYETNFFLSKSHPKAEDEGDGFRSNISECLLLVDIIPPISEGG